MIYILIILAVSLATLTGYLYGKRQGRKIGYLEATEDLKLQINSYGR